MSYVNSASLVQETPFSLRKYLYYSTLAGIFSEAAFLRLPSIDLQFFYVLMLGSLLLMLLLTQCSIPHRLIWLALYLSASGFIGIRNDTVTATLVARQVVGISVSAFYFYNFFQLLDDEYLGAFHAYAIGACWLSFAGFFILPIQVAVGWHHRLQSVFQEPSHYVTVCLPALYYFGYQWTAKRRYGRQLVVMLVAFLFSTSALGILGIAVGMFLLLIRHRYWKWIAPLLLAAVIALAAMASQEFRQRLVDTVVAAQTSNVEGANVSTYALISNMYVTGQVLRESPILGNGLGSHPISHARYLDQIPGVREFMEMNIEQMNIFDASSLALRALSELGILGLVGILAFIWHFRVPGSGLYAQISNAILLYFFLKLLRSGHYFAPEQFFFILIYILNHRRYVAAKQAGEAGHA
jgi:hypothetical protein